MPAGLALDVNLDEMIDRIVVPSTLCMDLHLSFQHFTSISVMYHHAYIGQKTYCTVMQVQSGQDDEIQLFNEYDR